MCGIAGFIYEADSPKLAAAAVRRMIALQRHRGPDGEGFYDSRGVSLGHCRLAIIDLSNTGHQPMSDAQGRYWITFNGEIYNYVELAQELRNLGHHFRGQSDTEVLLTAYQQWGQSCLDRLRGMFAFAIWDEEKRCLFAARDRLGIKPFFYWTNGKGRLAFASELKALLDFLPDRQVNLRLAREFLAWNLLDHEASETMVVGIHRLPAAHAMTWRPGQQIALQRYWRLEFNDDLETPSANRAMLISEFRRRFEETVSLHLRSDVPVGTCLSGGLDSSAIVCVLSAELKKRGTHLQGWQQTFTACFADPSIDERPYVEAVAATTGSQTHFVFPRAEGLREELDRWIWHQEEPVSGSSAYAQYCVARLAHEHGIKVLLDGQGADEQLAGYRKFILVYLRQLLKRHRYGKALKEAILFSSPEIIRTSNFLSGRRYLLSSLPEINLLWPDACPPERPSDLSLGNSLARRLEADMMRFSLPLLLRLEDRNTMAFGVEARVPFVDHTLVEWLASLPADMRLGAGWTKVILREALVGILPDSVRMRKSKLNFSTPESTWIAGPLSGWLRETLQESIHLSDVVDLKRVRRILAQRTISKHPAPIKAMLLRLALYELWARRFLASTKGLSMPRELIYLN